MIVPPMIFFSVMTGITGMDNSTDLGRISGKFFAISMAKLFIIVILGALISEIFFNNGLSEALSAIKTDGNEIQPANFSLRDVIVGIIPSDVIEPFRSGKILQVLFMACFFGVIINKSGDRAYYVKDLISFLNDFCLDVVNVVVKFIPPVIFFSMSDMIMNLGLDIVISLGKIILGGAIGVIVIIIVDGLLIGLFVSSPLTFWRKILPLKLGIDPKLAMFAVPIGVQLNMNGNGFYFSFISLLMANTFGLEVDFNLIMTVIISSLLISCSTSDIPGSIIMGLPPIFSAIGVPLSAVSIVICIFSIIGMFATVGNVASDISSTFLLSKVEKKFDAKIFSTN